VIRGSDLDRTPRFRRGTMGSGNGDGGPFSLRKMVVSALQLRSLMPLLHRSSHIIAAFFALGTLVACGSSSSDDDGPVGPAPTDPIVYEASAETTRDVGIVRWGHATDTNDDATVFRGYGRRNELLVEIRQTFTQQDTYTKSFEMKMTGAAGSGSQRIDFVAEWAADGKSMDYVTHVRENTFTAGSSPPVPNDCPGTTNDKTACTTCCTAQADNVNGLFGAKEKYKKQITEYRDRCAVACVDRDKLRKQVQAAASKCIANLVEWVRNKMEAKTSCSAPPKK